MHDPAFATDSEFSLSAGRQRKEIALDAVAEKRKQVLIAAKAIAISLAKTQGVVTIDDVFRELAYLNLEPRELSCAAGCVFRGKHWECVGWEPSERASNHARPVRQWRLKDGI